MNHAIIINDREDTKSILYYNVNLSSRILIIRVISQYFSTCHQHYILQFGSIFFHRLSSHTLLFFFNLNNDNSRSPILDGRNLFYM